MPRTLTIVLTFIFCSIFFSSKLVSSETDVAVVTFTIDFPTSQPEHYSIRIPSAGPGHYKSSGRISDDSDATDQFDVAIPITAATRQRIFELSSKAGYFEKD